MRDGSSLIIALDWCYLKLEIRSKAMGQVLLPPIGVVFLGDGKWVVLGVVFVYHLSNLHMEY